MKRRRLLAASAIAAFAASRVGFVAAAEHGPYPSRPIRILVGFASGGPADAVARAIGKMLQSQMQHAVVVENRTGADGSVALEMLKNAEPDGHTVLLTQNSVTVNPSLYTSVPFDPLADFAPIAYIGEGTNFVAINPSVPAATLTEFLAHAKANPGKLNYAATSSANELACELLAQMGGIRLTRVPYRGAAPAMPDLISGQIHLMVSNIATLLPHVKSGRIRALAVTGLKRSQLSPETPTVSELGLAGYSASTWYGLLAPAGTPKEIVERLHSEINRALADSGMQQQMIDLAVEVEPKSREEFSRFMVDDLEKWKRVVAASGGAR